MESYTTLVKQIPPPTWDQTARFARFVSAAHSWYKHLPVHPKVPFYLYLDPGAGMNYVDTPTGEVALVEITDNDQRFHYTWQTTATYRRRFGYWNYHANYGTRLSLLTAARDLFRTSGQSGLRVLSESGDWIEVPPDLAEQGTALVSALIHPNPSPQSWISAAQRQKFGLPFVSGMDDEERFEVLWDHIRCERAEQQPRFLRLGELLGETILESIHQLIPRGFPDFFPKGELGSSLDLCGWTFPTEPGFWDWPQADWWDQVRDLGVSDELVFPVLEFVEWQCQRSWLQILESHSKRNSPLASLRCQVNEQIAVEHTRQFAAVLAAMNRFAVGVSTS